LRAKTVDQDFLLAFMFYVKK